MNRNTEDRLRAAFRAKAAQVTPATLNAGRAPTGDDLAGSRGRGRGLGRGRFEYRWIAPMLAAAAVAAVVAGSAVISRSTAHHANPAVATPTHSTSAPASPQTPTTSPRHKTTGPVIQPTPRLTSHPVPPTSDVVPPPPPPPTHGPTIVNLAGVRVSLPVGWSQFPGPVSAAGVTTTWCVSSNGTRCDLYIVRADRGGPTLIIDSAVVARCATNPLTGYARRSIDGQAAEYRTFRAACGAPSGEQWFVPTNPQIVFWHPSGVNDAVVEQMVREASLPVALGPLPARDRGYLRSVTRGADGYHISLQREVDLPSGAIPEPGPQSTYSFVVPLNNSLQTTCSEWKIPGYQPFQHCDLSVLVTQSAKGASPTDGTLAIGSVQMVLWSDGRTVGALQTRDTFPGG